MSTLTNLDTAVAHKAFRSALLDIYNLLDWDDFFIGHHDPAPYINWVLVKKIQLRRLCLKNFKTDTWILRDFMIMNGKTLKVIKLVDSKSGMSAVMGYIASNCVVLETLWLENCNITKPLVNVLNKCTTLTELRIQSAGNKPSDPVQYEDIDTQTKSIFANVSCPSLRKLAVLDHMDLSEIIALTAAFPNVAEIELHGLCRCEPAFLALTEWTKLEKVDFNFPYGNLFSALMCAALALSAQTLRILNLNSATDEADLTALQALLSQCVHLGDVSIETCTPTEEQPDIAKIVAQCCAAKLVYLRVPASYEFTPEAVAVIADNCPNLIWLTACSLTRCANHGLVLKQCAKLETLYVGLGREFEPACRSLLSNMVQYCRNLKSVWFFFHAWRWSFEAELLAIIRNNKKLHTIGLNKKLAHKVSFSDELFTAALQANVSFACYEI